MSHNCRFGRGFDSISCHLNPLQMHLSSPAPTYSPGCRWEGAERKKSKVTLLWSPLVADAQLVGFRAGGAGGKPEPLASLAGTGEVCLERAQEVTGVVRLGARRSPLSSGSAVPLRSPCPLGRAAVGRRRGGCGWDSSGARSARWRRGCLFKRSRGAEAGGRLARFHGTGAAGAAGRGRGGRRSSLSPRSWASQLAGRRASGTRCCSCAPRLPGGLGGAAHAPSSRRRTSRAPERAPRSNFCPTSPTSAPASDLRVPSRAVRSGAVAGATGLAETTSRPRRSRCCGRVAAGKRPAAPAGHVSGARVSPRERSERRPCAPAASAAPRTPRAEPGRERGVGAGTGLRAASPVGPSGCFGSASPELKLRQGPRDFYRILSKWLTDCPHPTWSVSGCVWLCVFMRGVSFSYSESHWLIRVPLFKRVLNEIPWNSEFLDTGFSIETK